MMRRLLSIRCRVKRLKLNLRVTLTKLWRVLNNL